MLPQPNHSDAQSDGTMPHEHVSSPPGETAPAVALPDVSGAAPGDTPAASAASSEVSNATTAAVVVDTPEVDANALSTDESPAGNPPAPAVQPDTLPAPTPTPEVSTASALPAELPAIPALPSLVKSEGPELVKNVTTLVSTDTHRWLVDGAAKAKMPLGQYTQTLYANLRTYLQAYEQFGQLQSIAEQYQQVNAQLRSQHDLLAKQALTLQGSLKEATTRSEELAEQVRYMEEYNDRVFEENIPEATTMLQLKQQLEHTQEQLTTATSELDGYKEQVKQLQSDLEGAHAQTDKLGLAEDQLRIVGRPVTATESVVPAYQQRTDLGRVQQEHKQAIEDQQNGYNNVIKALVDHVVVTMPTSELVVNLRQRRADLFKVVERLYNLEFAPNLKNDAITKH